MRTKFRDLIKEIENEPIPPRKLMSLEFQLGHYIGESIAANRLPRLSIDCDDRYNVISVSEEDTRAYEETQANLENAERTSTGGINPESNIWKNYIAKRNELSEKYIPKELKCHVMHIDNVTDLDQLKSGIACALWNSDISHYSCNNKDIEITHDKYFSVVTLKRSNK